jgi:hypothetical protein
MALHEKRTGSRPKTFYMRQQAGTKGLSRRKVRFGSFATETLSASADIVTEARSGEAFSRRTKRAAPGLKECGPVG